MTPKAQIETLLKELEILYDTPADASHKDFYSKLALIELCGWLEISMDEIIKTYSNSKLVDQSYKDEIEQRVIEKTYGCDYNNHFRPMLMKLIGIKNIEQLETELKLKAVYPILVSQLGSLWTLRCQVAHTSIVGVTLTYQAPSAMKRYLDSLHPILATLEVELNKL